MRNVSPNNRQLIRINYVSNKNQQVIIGKNYEVPIINDNVDKLNYTERISKERQNKQTMSNKDEQIKKVEFV